MSNDYFKFRHFTVRQSHCGMKVGTDGTLLGAWAHGGDRILDVGTGTGLIALMMAQRFPYAAITGIDIDSEACQQAEENVNNSPFEVVILRKDVMQMYGVFDAIVSNPPFFDNSLVCPDAQRTLARHTTSLSYASLVRSAWRLLSDDGEFSLIIPSEVKSKIESETALVGFFKSRECSVKTTPRKQPRRHLLAFRKHPVGQLEVSEGVIETSPNCRSEWYAELTRDFYL